MPKCKNCQHDDFTHLLMEGRCQAWIVKYETPFVKTNEFGESMNAYAQSVEYEDQCPCEQFTLVQPSKRKRRRTSLEMSLDDYLTLPSSMKKQHNGRPV